MADPRVIELDEKSLQTLKIKEADLFRRISVALPLQLGGRPDETIQITGEMPLELQDTGERLLLKPAPGFVLTFNGKELEVLPAKAATEKAAGGPGLPTDAAQNNADNAKGQKGSIASAHAQQRTQVAQQGQDHEKKAPTAASAVTINPFGGIGGIFKGLADAVRRDPKAATTQFQAMTDSHATPSAAVVAGAAATATPSGITKALANMNTAGEKLLAATAAVDSHRKALGIPSKPWSELTPEQRALEIKDPGLANHKKGMTAAMLQFDKAFDPTLVDAAARANTSPNMSDAAKQALAAQAKQAFRKGGTLDKVNTTTKDQASRLNPDSEEGRAAKKLADKLQKAIAAIAKKIAALFTALTGGKRSAAPTPG
ncbi:MAG: hypothetical protein CVV05_01040 [Gammaproteobacteria bacterium HGW-Gammaproteobacteria-1]|jgi:hypothetical protein|nr:MAG: hypothetical protein CVV05_01040 [Gammaproteobacteria bacterium HGW-Gammaproteobacteria-1]